MSGGLADAAPRTARRRFPNPWSPLRGLPRPVWMLCVATLVNRCGTMALLFLVLYLTDRGWSARAAGWVVSAFGLGSVIAAPLAGRLCDRAGARRVVLLSLVSSGILLVVYPLMSGVVAVFVATILWSLTGEAFRPASYTLVSHAAPPAQRRAAFAALRVSVNVGASVGPALGGFLARVSMPALFVVDGATSIAAAFVLWATGRTRGADSTASDASANDMTTDAVAPTAPAPIPVVVAPRRHPLGPLSDLRFARLVLAMLLLTTAFFQVMSTLPLDLVRGQGPSETSLGFLYALNAILVVFCEIPLSVRMGHWPVPRAMALGALSIAVGVGATAFARDVWSAAATVAVWSFGEMVLFPAGSAYVAEITTPERRGEAMGAYTAAFGAGFILAPLLGTWLLGRWGADAAWAGAFAVGCAAAGMLLRLDAPAPTVVPSSSSVNA